jgi:anti-sigma regulatory factor (Ser/Thr protein kinase)
VSEAAQQCQLPEEKAQDLTLAASEAAMNAIVHAGGGKARVCADPAQGNVQVWIVDNGGGIGVDQLHRAILERGFTTGGVGFGHGYFLILRSAERVHLLTGSAGTTVVLEQTREPRQPTWTAATADFPNA